MFEAAEIGSVLSKPRYKAQVAKLRVQLLAAQHELAASGLSLVVLIGGVEGSGKGEVANLLLSWFDTRGVETYALGEPSDEERERPFFWRFWRLLPAARRTAFFLTSWYTDPVVARVFKRSTAAQFDRQLNRTVEFERMLAQENVVIVKLWFHLTKKEQRRRFKALEKDPDTRWRVTEGDWRFHAKYERFRRISEHALIATSTAQCPWQVVEAADRRHRNATAARLILETLRRGIASAQGLGRNGAPQRPKPKPNNIIRRLDLSLSLDDKTFANRLESLQGRLGLLTRRLRKRGRSLILAFEGPDAAGKGGAIRRLTQAMDAKLYTVHSVCAPTDEEKARPYLWRFWRVLPRTGRVTVNDRSWYGRVLVERIEGFAKPDEWRRAYSEINAFEEQLVDFGSIVLKFWIAISPQEELRRFRQRKETPYKQYKLTAEDWRNREKWNAYEAAACEMIEATNTARAPWLLVEGEDKNWARIKILETIIDRLEEELN